MVLCERILAELSYLLLEGVLGDFLPKATGALMIIGV